MNLSELLREISEKRERLEGRLPLTDGEFQRLWEDFVVEVTHHSTAIEGNTMTLEEVATLLRDGLTPHGRLLREGFEVDGHARACGEILKQARSEEPLFEEHLLSIHHHVLMDRPDDRGRYRCVPVAIRGSSQRLPAPEEIPSMMAELLGEYHGPMKRLPPVERAALFHLRYEAIHPHVDGNGRTGRLVINRELMREGFPPVVIRLSDRARYMRAIHSWADGGDTADMTWLLGAYLNARLDAALEIAAILEGSGPSLGV